MTYRYLVWDYSIEIEKPRYAADFDEEGNPVVGLSFKDAKKKLVDQIKEHLRNVKKETETDYLLRKGLV